MSLWDNDPYYIRQRLTLAEEMLKAALKKKGTPDYNPDTVNELKQAIREYTKQLRGRQ